MDMIWGNEVSKRTRKVVTIVGDVILSRYCIAFY